MAEQILNFYRNNNICFICKERQKECKVNIQTKLRCCSLKCHKELMKLIDEKKIKVADKEVEVEELEPGSTTDEPAKEA